MADNVANVASEMLEMIKIVFQYNDIFIYFFLFFVFALNMFLDLHSTDMVTKTDDCIGSISIDTHCKIYFKLDNLDKINSIVILVLSSI